MMKKLLLIGLVAGGLSLLRCRVPMLKSTSRLASDRATTDITPTGTIIRIVITVRTMATTGLTIGTVGTVTTVTTVTIIIIGNKRA